MTECAYGGDPLLYISGGSSRSSRASTVPTTGSIGGSRRRRAGAWPTEAARRSRRSPSEPWPTPG